jgi:hypothetical protein
MVGKKKKKEGRIKKKRKRGEAAGACSQCPLVTCVQLACHQWGDVCHVTSILILEKITLLQILVTFQL